MAGRHTAVVFGEVARLNNAELLRTINRAWQGMNFDAGHVATLLVEAGRRPCWPREFFPSFRAWVVGPPPRGLDRDPGVLLGVLHRSHLPKVEWALIELLKAPHGGDRKSAAAQAAIKPDNIRLDTGTSPTRALVQLARHRPDLHQQVLDGQLSAHAAMVAAGFRVRMISLPDDPQKAFAALVKRYGRAKLATIAAEFLADASHDPR